MRILVTGHNGFIGQHVVDLLTKNSHTVTTCEVPVGITVPGDFRNAVTDADAIIHLAGKNRAPDYELYTTNVLLTMSLVDAVKQYNPKAHIIFASSFQVMYETSLYGASKKASEEILSVYAKRDGVRSTILRLSNVYGPFCKPFYNSVIATYIYQAMHDLPLQLNGDGSQKRDYIYVADVARALLAAVIHPPKEKIATYAVCTGKQVSLNAIITRIGTASGKMLTVNKTNNPEPPALSIIKPDDAKKELGWKPTVSMGEGIRHIINKEYETTGTKT